VLGKAYLFQAEGGGDISAKDQGAGALAAVPGNWKQISTTSFTKAFIPLSRMAKRKVRRWPGNSGAIAQE